MTKPVSSITTAKTIIKTYEQCKETMINTRPTIKQIARATKNPIKLTEQILNAYFNGSLDRSGYRYEKTLFQ